MNKQQKTKHWQSIFKRQTIAEGIEVKSQYHFLKQLGCDKGQGYYMSMPIIESEILQLLLKE